MATAVPAQVGAPKSSSVAVAVVANPVAVASVVVAADDDAPPEGCAPQGCLTREYPQTPHAHFKTFSVLRLDFEQSH